MNNLKITQYKVIELNFNKLVKVEGGCSFAYDIGFLLRLSVTPDHLKGFEIAMYDIYCNQSNS